MVEVSVVIVEGFHDLSAVLARDRQAIVAVSNEPKTTQLVGHKLGRFRLFAVVDVIGLGIVESDGGDQSTQEVRLVVVLARNVDDFERLELLQAQRHASQLPVRVDLCGDELQRSVIRLQGEAATEEEVLPLDECPQDGCGLLFDRRIPLLGIIELLAGVLDDSALAIDFLHQYSAHASAGRVSSDDERLRNIGQCGHRWFGQLVLEQVHRFLMFGGPFEFALTDQLLLEVVQALSLRGIVLDQDAVLAGDPQKLV